MKINDTVRVIRTNTTNSRVIERGEVGNVEYVYKNGFCSVWLVKDRALHLLRNEDLEIQVIPN